MRRLLAICAAGATFLAAQSAAATIRPQYGMSRVVLGMTKTQVRADSVLRSAAGAGRSTTRASGSASVSDG